MVFLMVFSWYLMVFYSIYFWLIGGEKGKPIVTKVKKLFGLVVHDWKMSWWSCITGFVWMTYN